MRQLLAAAIGCNLAWGIIDAVMYVMNCITERSGKSLWIHHRLACRKFIKQTFHEIADHARAYYDQMRSRGKDHHAALRALANKWIRILFRCWKDRKPYDEAKYIQALRRRGSVLVENFS